MNMKYLKLYEAFGSIAFSKTIEYLKNKFGLETSKVFMSMIKHIMSVYDLPLSQISDDNMEYLSKKHALKIKPTEPSKNKWGIYCIKCWFSLDQGYIGSTGTGDLVIDFDSWMKGKPAAVKKETFNPEELEYIKNTLGITTGTLVPVSDYARLQLGDEVVGYFSKARDKAFLSKAKIWTDEKYLKAIQNVAKGKDPKKETIGELNWRTWGEGSWGIGRPGKVSPDHLLLHHYINGSEPLKVVTGGEFLNPLDYNLPFKNNGTLTNWNEAGYSIPQGFKVLDRADFAIVIYLDKMIGSVPFVKTIKKQREDIKKGATKFMKDEDIKNINIRRYLAGIISSMGITKDIKGLKNLQKAFSRSMCGDYSFVAIYRGVPSTDYLNAFINSVKKLLIASKATAGSKLTDVVNVFDALCSESLLYQDVYNKSWEIIYHNGTPQQKEIAHLIRLIGSKIRNYIGSQNVETFEDLKMLYYKVRSLRGLIQDADFQFSDAMKYIINDFNRPERTIVHCREFAEYDYAKDIIKLRYIDKYVDSIIK